jgi:TonB-dependent receptor
MSRDRCVGSLLFTASVAAAFMALLWAAVMLASPESGEIKGRVMDSSGQALPGATVRVDPPGLTAVTDFEGYFVLSRLATGPAKVVASYIGFVSATQDVTVENASVVRLEFKLAQDERVKEDVVVTASRERGEVEALNERKNSENVVNVLPEEVITSLPNANVADALGRVPSVSLERDEGEGKYVQVRGLEPRLTNVTINGIHIPSVSGSNENFGRQIKLDAFPSDLVGELQLYKTTSADQDGDALGGSVNIVTRAAGNEPAMNLSVIGGHTDIIGGRYNYQVAGNYSSRLGSEKEFGVVLGGTYDWNGRGINDIEPAPDVVTLPDGTDTSAFTAIDYRDYRYQRSRYGFAGGLDWQVDPNTGLYLKGFFAQFQNYGDRWVTSANGGTFLTPTRTDSDGNFEASVQDRRPNDQTYSIALGGKTDLRTVLLDYVVSYSHARQNRIDQRQAKFDGPPAAFEIDGTDGEFPVFTPIGGVNQLDPSLYTLSNYTISDERTKAHDAAIAANAAFPYQLGSYPGWIKVGGKYRDEHKDVFTNDKEFNPTGDVTYLMSQGIDSFKDPNYYFGRYPQGPNASLAAVTDFFNANPGAFEEDTNSEHLDNDPNNFTARERVSAGYVMNTTSLGPVDLRFGVRVEHTDAGYTGFLVNTDADGNWVSTVPTSGDSSYTNALPSVSVRWAIDSSTNLRAVYGWLIGRPDYGELAPSAMLNPDKKEIDAGNPNLKPTQSRSYDLLFEHFFSSVGVISGGLFYKDLKDPIYPGSASTIHGGPHDGFLLVQPVNGPKAKIYGWEIAWQQHLRFLPGVLSGLGVDANYTYTNSKATFDPSTGRTGDARLQRTTPSEYNAGITYDWRAFSMRAAVTYNAATIWEYQFVDGAPGGQTGPKGDIYLYPHTQVDLQATYSLPSGLQVLFSALNLNNQVFGFYTGDPHWNLQREFYSRTFALGVRWNR